MNTEFKVEYMKIKLGIAIFFILTLFTGTVSASAGCTIDSNMGENLDTKVCDAQNYTIMIEGKSLDNQNIMQQRSMFIDKFLNETNDEKEPRHIGKVKNLKSPKNTELVAYGFKIFSNGVVKEYRGYCNNVSKGYEKALSEADKWYNNISIKPSNIAKTNDGTDITTSEFGIASNRWDHICTVTDDYIYSPYGDFSITTRWYWDDQENDENTDYFLLRSRYNMLPGNQLNDKDWFNSNATIHHDWIYHDYSGTRQMGDAKPYDGRSEPKSSLTLFDDVFPSALSITIPEYNLDDTSDYIDETAKWEAEINLLYSIFSGNSTTIETSSTMEWSQNNDRTDEWVDLACFETKPEWVYLNPYDILNPYAAFTPGFLGQTCCIKWTGIAFQGSRDS
ncbi:hypothetical protein Metev_1483 [Methanohalobium evestigatum Z-7303]|uniref:Uncharacterized protein n=1 Tax=Methanohalobium evestigatum (strain ATCC BAA-1072 / DSM 3721 / NBRC 107634 / OCM 161 / Z-7303) TaxID=644295 RepID=D7E9R4_METEZ|nr:hypothetical protein [Methanohalobium evestigatum]ADI74336.1 hypothetical protein Metev_1483 [Methanohalobium evestigatum Z-7303]